jgi:hypothetical protein
VRGDEIDSVVARLRAEVEATYRAANPAEEEGSERRLEARAEADRLWAVVPDRPLPPWPGWRGLLARWGWAGLFRRAFVVPVKLVVRKLIRWYVDPPVHEQRRFNDVTLRLIDELTERTARQAEELAALRRDLEAREGGAGRAQSVVDLDSRQSGP